MKPVVFVCSVLLIASGTTGISPAADTNWIQAGIRPWYFGATQAVPKENEDPKPSTPIGLAFLVRDLQGEIVNMTQYSWSPSMVSTSWLGFTSAPAVSLSRDEGPFWILPSRLQPLQTGAEMSWQGKKRTVTERKQLTADKVPVALLPARAMFQLTGQRDLLWLQFKTNEQNRTEDTLFDIETGLVLYHTAVDTNTRMYLCLAELNYDFAAKRGFAEDAGLHTSFAGVFGAATLGTGAFSFYSQVQTRYKDEVVVNIITILTGTGAQMSFKNHLLYFNGRGEARIVESALLPPPLEQWKPCGDHNFWWIPPTDLASAQITAWGTPMQRAGTSNNRTTFSTRDAPADPGLRSLTFDARGYLCDISVLNQQLGINVDTAGLCFNRKTDIMGPSDYAGMTRAAPVGGQATVPSETGTNAVRLVFGQQVLTAPAGVALSGRAKPKTTATGLDGIRAEYEAARTDIEQVAGGADNETRGRVVRDQLRQLDKYYMDLLDRMQKEAKSAAVHGAIDSEKMRVWKNTEGKGR